MEDSILGINSHKICTCETNFHMACFSCHSETHSTGLGWKYFYPSKLKNSRKKWKPEEKTKIQQWEWRCKIYRQIYADDIFGKNKNMTFAEYMYQLAKSGADHEDMFSYLMISNWAFG